MGHPLFFLVYGRLHSLILGTTLVGQCKKRSLEKLEKVSEKHAWYHPQHHCCGAWKKLGNNETILNTKSIWWKNHLVDVIVKLIQHEKKDQPLKLLHDPLVFSNCLKRKFLDISLKQRYIGISQTKFKS